MKTLAQITDTDNRVRSRYIIAGDEIVMLSDNYEGKLYDTEVWINGRYIITIPYDMKTEFLADLEKLIIKYKI
jgi:hypothetical protein